MPNAKDLKPDKRVYALLLGKGGSGKTCAELSWAPATPEERAKGLGKTYVFDLDQNIKAALGLPALKDRLESGDIEYDWFDFTKETSGFFKMDDKMGSLAEDSRKLVPTYKNIIFDSASALRRGLLATSQLYTPKNYKMGRVQMYDKPNYGFEAKVTYDLFYNHFKQLQNTNVFLSGHIVPEFNDEGNVVGTKMLGSEKIAAEIPSYFTEVWEFFKDDAIRPVKYICRFRSALARTTFSQLPDEIDWTGKNFYETVMGIMNGTLDAKGNKK